MSGETLGEVKVVRDMHERKSEMAKHSDAFVALPGHTQTAHPIFSPTTQTPAITCSLFFFFLYLRKKAAD